MQKVISFKVTKGPKYAPEFVKEETDLTAEMLAKYDLHVINDTPNMHADSAQWLVEDRPSQALQLQIQRRSDTQRSFTSLYASLTEENLLWSRWPILTRTPGSEQSTPRVQTDLL